MGTGKNAGREIKEWQAIMDHLRNVWYMCFVVESRVDFLKFFAALL